MTIFAENPRMELAFNKILKEDIYKVLPMVHELGEFQTNIPLLEERFSEMLEQNYECFGVFYKKQIIGVFGLWFMTRHYAGRSCEVDHVFIKPEFQNQGIGNDMIGFILEYISKKGCEMVELNAYLHNIRSHKFYEAQGFERKGYHFLKKV